MYTTDCPQSIALSFFYFPNSRTSKRDAIIQLDEEKFNIGPVPLSETQFFFHLSSLYYLG